MHVTDDVNKTVHRKTDHGWLTGIICPCSNCGMGILTQVTTWFYTLSWEIPVSICPAMVFHCVLRGSEKIYSSLLRVDSKLPLWEEPVPCGAQRVCHRAQVNQTLINKPKSSGTLTWLWGKCNSVPHIPLLKYCDFNFSLLLYSFS